LQLLLTLVPLVAPAAHADTLSFTGVFAEDDDQQTFLISVPVATTLALQSWSFAGGVNAAGDVIPAGGFPVVISLFDPSGNLFAYDAGGTAPDDCAPRNIDTVTGFCLDGYLNVPVTETGTWTAVLTEYDNTPNGPTLADGFAEQGNGDFNNGFMLLYTYQRTDAWALDIDDGLTSGTPEPNSLYLFAGGLAACLGRRYIRRRTK